MSIEISQSNVIITNHNNDINNKINNSIQNDLKGKVISREQLVHFLDLIYVAGISNIDTFLNECGSINSEVIFYMIACFFILFLTRHHFDVYTLMFYSTDLFNRILFLMMNISIFIFVLNIDNSIQSRTTDSESNNAGVHLGNCFINSDYIYGLISGYLGCRFSLISMYIAVINSCYQYRQFNHMLSFICRCLPLCIGSLTAIIALSIFRENTSPLILFIIITLIELLGECWVEIISDNNSSNSDDNNSNTTTNNNSTTTTNNNDNNKQIILINSLNPFITTTTSPCITTSTSKSTSYQSSCYHIFLYFQSSFYPNRSSITDRLQEFYLIISGEAIYGLLVFSIDTAHTSKLYITLIFSFMLIYAFVTHFLTTVHREFDNEHAMSSPNPLKRILYIWMHPILCFALLVSLNSLIQLNKYEGAKDLPTNPSEDVDRLIVSVGLAIVIILSKAMRIIHKGLRAHLKLFHLLNIFYKVILALIHFILYYAIHNTIYFIMTHALLASIANTLENMAYSYKYNNYDVFPMHESIKSIHSNISNKSNDNNNNIINNNFDHNSNSDNFNNNINDINNSPNNNSFPINHIIYKTNEEFTNILHQHI